MVQSSSLEPGKILFTCKDQLRSYNYKTNKITNYRKLEFQPRCFTEKDGLIVSGGVASSHTGTSASNSSSTSHSKGLLNIYNKDLEVNNTVRVGSLINNNVALYRSSNSQFKCLVSNNDYCLYSCDIQNNGSVKVKDEFNLGFAVNHASLSPDKKTTVACGDSKKIVLLHEGAGSSKQAIPSHKKISLKTSFDSGISSAFNSDGKQFCCAFQDGVTVVYDVRNYKKPLHTIFSTRPKAQHGAFRCCKFSGGTDDLLIISEHTGRVHLVDTRNFDKHQVVMLPKLIYSPGTGASDGVYHEPLVREYQYAVSSFNSMSENSIRSNVSSDYLYLSNGILSEHNPYDNSHNDSDISFLDDDCDPRNNLENQDWSEVDQETSFDSQRTTDGLYANSNNMFFVNHHFSGRRVTPTRFSSDNSEYHLMYDDSLVDINGIDWYYDPDTGKSHLLVGCDKGLFRWEVDSWSRRCFPTFEIC